MGDPTRWDHYVNYSPVKIKNERKLHELSSDQLFALYESIKTGEEEWWKDYPNAEGSYEETCYGHIEALGYLAFLVGPLYDCAQKKEIKSACEFLRQTGGEKTKGTVSAKLPCTAQYNILSFLYGKGVIDEAKAHCKKQILKHKTPKHS